MEGVLVSDKDYSCDEKRAKKFVSELSSFCKKNNTELYLVSGFHEPVAHAKFNASFLHSIFDEKHFLHVDENYILSKGEADEKLHRGNLEKDPQFNDSYFKQVAMERVLASSAGATPLDALLLSEDLWVDGYYTKRFSKVDFALFEENLRDRGKKTERLSGLAYFNLDFSSVKVLLENFPSTDMRLLEKHVFDIMKAALIGEAGIANLANTIKEKKLKKN